MSIVVVDLGVSNLTSVVNALRFIGGDTIVSSNPEVITNADKVILPGVGSFGACYHELKSLALEEVILKHARVDEKPLLGICLGMQMLATMSEEGGEYSGLDLISGRVKKLSVTQGNYRVPNIGWCDVKVHAESELLLATGVERSFYHVHSYYFDCDDQDNVIATINFSGRDIPVMIKNKNIYGVQFHPEKSQDNGLELLNQFVNL